MGLIHCATGPEAVVIGMSSSSDAINPFGPNTPAWVDAAALFSIGEAHFRLLADSISDIAGFVGVRRRPITPLMR